MQGASVIQIPLLIKGRGEALPRSIDLMKLVELQRAKITQVPVGADEAKYFEVPNIWVFGQFISI